MNIFWEIEEKDIYKVKDFIHLCRHLVPAERISRNIDRKELIINRDTILRTMFISMLGSPDDPEIKQTAATIYKRKPFLGQYDFLYRTSNINLAISEALRNQGLIRQAKKLPEYFEMNFMYLEETEWELEKILTDGIARLLPRQEERELADAIDQWFKGFGSKEARYFLQTLGITRYEIPVDAPVIAWMREFGFPVLFDGTALQDKSFYHLITDGIQILCDEAEVFPCVLHAAITANFSKI